MQRKKKILILIASFLLLAVVLTTPLAELGRFGGAYDKRPEPEQTLSLEELNAFLNVWSEFMRKDIAGYSSLQLSLSSGGAADGFPPQLVRWLGRQGWNVERFFYNEQKVRGLLRAAALEENLNANRRLLKEAHGNDNLKNIIRSQEEQLGLIKVNPEELALIKANLYQVNQIMDGKAVLKN